MGSASHRTRTYHRKAETLRGRLPEAVEEVLCCESESEIDPLKDKGGSDDGDDDDDDDDFEESDSKMDEDEDDEE